MTPSGPCDAATEAASIKCGKVSACRVKYQIYLSISARCSLIYLKLVQAE